MLHALTIIGIMLQNGSCWRWRHVSTPSGNNHWIYCRSYRHRHLRKGIIQFAPGITCRENQSTTDSDMTMYSYRFWWWPDNLAFCMIAMMNRLLKSSKQLCTAAAFMGIIRILPLEEVAFSCAADIKKILVGNHLLHQYLGLLCRFE